MTNQHPQESPRERVKTPLGVWQQASWTLVAGLGLVSFLAIFKGLPAADAGNQENQSCTAPSPLDIAPPQISPEAAHELAEQGGASFVDCRSQREFQEGHIAGAVHLPAEALQLSVQARELLASAPTVITYCDAACARSSKVAQHVIEAGFQDVRILEGGMPAWLDAGYPAESGSCSLCEHH